MGKKRRALRYPKKFKARARILGANNSVSSSNSEKVEELAQTQSAPAREEKAAPVVTPKVVEAPVEKASEPTVETPAKQPAGESAPEPKPRTRRTRPASTRSRSRNTTKTTDTTEAE